MNNTCVHGNPIATAAREMRGSAVNEKANRAIEIPEKSIVAVRNTVEVKYAKSSIDKVTNVLLVSAC